MPRNARSKSNTAVYHCILRGIDKQIIFLDNQDREKFIKELTEMKQKYEFKLYSYCMMDNHVHMAIKDEKDNLHKIMHGLAVRFSIYFNKKYDRTGHLFQNRYLSKPIENQDYLLTVQRYIMQNPSNMSTYEWSSYKDYIGRNGITDTEFVLSLFDEDNEKAIMKLKKFMSYTKRKYDVEYYKDGELLSRISDDEVIRIIKQNIEVQNIMQIKKYNTKIRNNYIKKILLIDGITVKQVSRILGIDRKEIQRINEQIRPVPKCDICRTRETSPKEEKNG